MASHSTTTTAALLLLLLLLPALSASDVCRRTGTVVYQDPWGPIFTENTYKCSLPPSSSSSSSTASLPRQELLPSRRRSPTQQQQQQQPLQARSPAKTTIKHYGCSLLPGAKQLDPSRYSNLFWGMRQLTNQSCIEPQEAREYVDAVTDWSADWRFVVVNTNPLPSPPGEGAGEGEGEGGRARGRVCEWWTELANIAEALHFVCVYSEIGTGLGESNGGVEAVAWGFGVGGRDGGGGESGEGGVRWCLRYSRRGWDDDVWRRFCLGI